MSFDYLSWTPNLPSNSRVRPPIFFGYSSPRGHASIPPITSTRRRPKLNLGDVGCYSNHLWTQSSIILEYALSSIAAEVKVTNSSPALDLSLPLPSPKVLGRWHAEPAGHLLLPSTAFIANSKGYPVLPKAMQSFLRDFIKHSPTILLSGTKNGLHAKGGYLAYGDYIRHLEKTSPVVLAAEKPGTVESFAQGYWDYLQAPLQVRVGTFETKGVELTTRETSL